ncbi:MAG: hypothetical protein Q8R57_01900 [Bacteroidota bacterium]|nr:hypothetical protein [Bacteroidota bacterium]
MRTLKDGGFARQVENFRLLINLATQLGTAYNPVKDNLKLVNMQTLHTEAAKAVDDWIEAINTIEKLTSQRTEELKKVNNLVTRISREVKVCGIRGERLTDINAAIRQVRGRKATSNNKTTDGQNNTTPSQTTQEKGGGVNHTIERKMDAFHRLVKILEDMPEYESNDLDLQITGLKAKSTEIKTLQNDYGNELINRERQKAIRNRLTLNDLVSIAYVGRLAKDYLRNQYKGSKAELNTLRAIRFKAVEA